MLYEMSDNERVLLRFNVSIDQEHLHIVVVRRYCTTSTAPTSTSNKRKLEEVINSIFCRSF